MGCIAIKCREGAVPLDLGPIELLAIEFPGNEFRGEIAPALRKLVDNGTMRVIDLVFVTRDAEGVVASRELSEVELSPT